MSNSLMWQRRLTCWSMEQTFRQNYRLQTNFCPFHERYFCGRILAIALMHVLDARKENELEWRRWEPGLASKWGSQSDVVGMEWKSQTAKFFPGLSDNAHSLLSLTSAWHPQLHLAKQNHVLCIWWASLGGYTVKQGTHSICSIILGLVPC